MLAQVCPALSVVGALWDDRRDPCTINSRIIYIHTMNVTQTTPEIAMAGRRR